MTPHRHDPDPSAAQARATRRPLRLLAGATVAVVLLTAGPARADVPEGWSDPEPVGLLDFLWVLVGVPLGLFVVVAVLAWLPGLLSGERIGASAAPENAWFGGAPDGPAELSAAEGADTGGASARW